MLIKEGQIMGILIFVVIMATNITLLQIKFLHKHKKLINIITAFAMSSWFVILIVHGIISGRAKSNFSEMRENYPIYIIVFVVAITIQLLLNQKKNQKEDK
jgi:formate-dependent nitrite reductase membrane component NrfD